MRNVLQPVWNETVFEPSAKNLDGCFRLDPAYAEGEYILETLEVKYPLE